MNKLEIIKSKILLIKIQRIMLTEFKNGYYDNLSNVKQCISKRKQMWNQNFNMTTSALRNDKIRRYEKRRI